MASLSKGKLFGLTAVLLTTSVLAGWEDSEFIKSYLSERADLRGHHLSGQLDNHPGKAKGEERDERNLLNLNEQFFLKFGGNEDDLEENNDLVQASFMDEIEDKGHKKKKKSDDADDSPKNSKSRKDDDSSSGDTTPAAKAPSNSPPSSKSNKSPIPFSKSSKRDDVTDAPTFVQTYVPDVSFMPTSEPTFYPTESPTRPRTKSAKTSGKSDKSSKSAKTAPIVTDPPTPLPTTEPPTTEPPSTEPPTTVTPTISMMPSEKATTMPSTSMMPTKKETPEPTTSMMPSDPDAPSAPPSSSAMPSPPPTDSMPPSDAPTTPQPTFEPTHSPNLCNKHADIAFTAIETIEEEFDFDIFPNITSPDDVKTLCEFTPHPEAEFNFGCNFLFIPQFGFIEDYSLVFDELPAATFQAIDNYCECYLGYQLQCANDIPHGGPPTEISYDITGTFTVPSYSEYIPFSTPGVRADYCVFASIWNGDIAYDDAVLPERVEECGCYWVSEAKNMVSECPGLNLGAFFNETAAF